jgi:hypothetical protein
MTGFLLSFLLFSLTQAPGVTAPPAVDPAVAYGGLGPLAPWKTWTPGALSGCLQEPVTVLQGEDARPNAKGGLVAFTEGPAGRRVLRLLELSASKTRTLVEELSDNLDPAPSADGDRVFFSSNRRGSFDLFVVPTAGGEPQPLTNLDGDERNPTPNPRTFRVISPEGTCQQESLSPSILVFEHRVADRSDLRWVDDTGTRGGLLASACAEPAWSADGSLLLAHCGDRFVVFRLDFPTFQGAWRLALSRLVEFPDRELLGAVLLPSGTHVVAMEANAPWRLLARPVFQGQWEPLPLGETLVSLAASPADGGLLYSRREGAAVITRSVGFTCDFSASPPVFGLLSDPLRLGALRQDGMYLEFPLAAPLADPVSTQDSAKILTIEPLLDTFVGVLAAAIQAIEEEQSRTLWRLTDALWKRSLEAHTALQGSPDTHYALLWAAVPMLFRREWMPSPGPQVAPPAPPTQGPRAPSPGLPPPPGGPRRPRPGAEVPPLGTSGPTATPTLAEDLPLEVPESLKADLALLLDHIAAGRLVELPGGFLGYPFPRTLRGDLLLAAGQGEDRLRWYRMALVWYRSMPLPLGLQATSIPLAIHDDPQLWAAWNDLESWAEFAYGSGTNPTLIDYEASFAEHPHWRDRLVLDQWQAFLDARVSQRAGVLPPAGPPQGTLLTARTPLLRRFAELLLHPQVEGRRGTRALDLLALLGHPLAIQGAAVPEADDLWSEDSFRAALAKAVDLFEDSLKDRTPDLETRWIALLGRLLDPLPELAGTGATWTPSQAYASRRLAAAVYGQQRLGLLAPALPRPLEAKPQATPACPSDQTDLALAPAWTSPTPMIEALPGFYLEAAALALDLRQRLDTTQVSSESCGEDLWSPCQDPSEWLGRLATLFTTLGGISERQLQQAPLTEQEVSLLLDLQAFLALQRPRLRPDRQVPREGSLQLRLLQVVEGAPVLFTGQVPYQLEDQVGDGAVETPWVPPYLRFFVLPSGAPLAPPQEP